MVSPYDQEPGESYNQSPAEDSPPSDDAYIIDIDATDGVAQKLAERSTRPMLEDVRGAILPNRHDDATWEFDEKHGGWRLIVEATADSHRKEQGRKLRAILVPERWYDLADGWWFCKSAWWLD